MPLWYERAVELGWTCERLAELNLKGGQRVVGVHRNAIRIAGRVGGGGIYTQTFSRIAGDPWCIISAEVDGWERIHPREGTRAVVDSVGDAPSQIELLRNIVRSRSLAAEATKSERHESAVDLVAMVHSIFGEDCRVMDPTAPDDSWMDRRVGCWCRGHVHTEDCPCYDPPPQRGEFMRHVRAAATRNLPGFLDLKRRLAEQKANDKSARLAAKQAAKQATRRSQKAARKPKDKSAKTTTLRLVKPNEPI